MRLHKGLPLGRGFRVHRALPLERLCDDGRVVMPHAQAQVRHVNDVPIRGGKIFRAGLRLAAPPLVHQTLQEDLVDWQVSVEHDLRIVRWVATKAW